MVLKPINTAIAHSNLSDIRLIATDVDGTLTQDEKFTPKLIQAIDKLSQVGIEVMLITGRSAGWVQALNHYLPVRGAMAENGGIFYDKNHHIPQFITPISDPDKHRQNLAKMFQSLTVDFPNLQPSTDNLFRLTDWTFDVKGLDLNTIKKLAQRCITEGWGFTYSTVQCHIKPQFQEKATGLKQVLSDYFPHLSPQQIITIGDSPNDESLFDQTLFPQSVGVANLLKYTEQLTHKPTFITTESEVDGFCQLVEILINCHSSELRC
ncbi:MAG: HAD family hydrolase [Microcoleaceae cyanobacterium]